MANKTHHIEYEHLAQSADQCKRYKVNYDIRVQGDEADELEYFSTHEYSY